MNRQAGFTLIELLCALTILALVLGVSLRILGDGSRITAVSRDSGRALAVAEAHLALLEAASRVTALERSGSDDGVGWQEIVSRASDAAFAAAPAARMIAWRLTSIAHAADGRSIVLTSVRLERLP